MNSNKVKIPTEPPYLRLLLETENGSKRVTEMLLEMTEQELVRAMETLKHQMMKAILEVTLKGMNDEQKKTLLGTITQIVTPTEQSLGTQKSPKSNQ